MFLITLSLFIGLLLRLISINQSLWLDEAISATAVTSLPLSELLNQFMIGDFNPPLFNLVLFYWLKIFPAGELFIRLPSLIFGLLTIVFVYKIYLLIFKDKKGAIISMALLATSPLHVYYSQEARMYSLAALTTAGSMYYFIKLLKEKNSLFTIHYSLFTILMLYSHYLCWFILAVQFLYLFLYKKSKLKFFIFHFSFLIFLYLPWLPNFLKQLSMGFQESQENVVWKSLSTPSIKTVALLPVKFIIGRTTFANKGLYYLLMFVLILFFSYFIWHACNIKNKENKAIFLWLFLPPLMGIVLGLKVAVFSYFRFLYCLPAFYILIALGILTFKAWKKLVCFVLCLNLFFSCRYLLNPDFHREDWRQALKTLHQKNLNNSPILIIESVAAPFNYYDKQKSNLVFFSQKELISNNQEVWLIPYAQPIMEPEDTTRSFLKIKGFQRVYEEHFRGVTLEKWQKVLAIKYN